MKAASTHNKMLFPLGMSKQYQARPVMIEIFVKHHKTEPRDIIYIYIYIYISIQNPDNLIVCTDQIQTGGSTD
jgi:hypothetical protein